MDLALLQERSVANYSRLLAEKKLLVINEAQYIPSIGLILKLIIDSIEGIHVIASGTSTFELGVEVQEPLVGRKNTIYLIPLVQIEHAKIEDLKTILANREERLIFGDYPELSQDDDWRDKKD